MNTNATKKLLCSAVKYTRAYPLDFRFIQKLRERERFEKIVALHFHINSLVFHSRSPTVSIVINSELPQNRITTLMNASELFIHGALAITMLAYQRKNRRI